MQSELQQKRDGTGWVRLYEDLADAISAFSDIQLRCSLFDLLADALESCTISFPIMHSGEELNSIDPFTFFASFNWSYSPEQRIALLSRLASLLGLGAENDEAAAPYFERCSTGSTTVENCEIHVTDCKRSSGLPDLSLEQSFGHGFFVAERELRFFTFNDSQVDNEINLLWSLFSSSLFYARRKDDGAQELFIKAYNDVLAKRVKGTSVITTALHWMRPDIFLPVHRRLGSFIGSKLSYDPEFYSSTPKAEEYLKFLDECSEALECRVFGEQVDSFSALACQAWQATEEAPSRINESKTKQLLSDYTQQREQAHSNNVQLWRAVKCFQDNWDVEADDFAAMLKRALAEHGSLLASSNMFNPYWEIIRFARREPETVRSAFVELFNNALPLTARLLRFEEETSALYTRYREDMVRAFAKRSAHGNFTAIATYLFLRFPDSTYLYSPLRINAIIPRVGYDTAIRVALPESVEQYYDLCDQIREVVLADSILCETALKCIDPSTEYSDPLHHLLVEDIISFTL